MTKRIAALAVLLFATLLPAAAHAAIIVSPPGPAPHVRMFDVNGNPQASFFAYDTRFGGGVSVAIGDVLDDAAPEIITGAGPGGGPNVHVYSLGGDLLADFNAYADEFHGGVFVAAGDVQGDGKAEIITGPGYGGGPEVRIFNGNGALLNKWFAYDPNFPGGVHVAAGGMQGLLNGPGAIVTAPAFAGGPHVRVLNAAGEVQREWMAYAPGFTGGVNVAVANNRVVTAPASNGGPHVKVFDTNGALQNEWFAYGANFTGGVTVGGGGDGTIVTGAGRDGGPHVRAFTLTGGDKASFFAYDPAYPGGVNVATDGNHIVTGAGIAKLVQLIQQGDCGSDVADLQNKLLTMGYWLPGVDSCFGSSTLQAVWAFQKANGLPRDGKIGPEDSVVLASGNRPTAASTSGNLVEVDKARQVLFVIRGGAVQWAFNISSGSNTYYTYGGQRYFASTPEGRFTFSRQIDGYHESHLGTMYRPKYFTSAGHAIHGSPSIPPYPASHGCARVSNAAINMIWANGLMPMGSRVYVH
jgi:peptidoglycan hydrolase-like protein with peptidoglycan-binding domain